LSSLSRQQQKDWCVLTLPSNVGQLPRAEEVKLSDVATTNSENKAALECGVHEPTPEQSGQARALAAEAFWVYAVPEPCIRAIKKSLYKALGIDTKKDRVHCVSIRPGEQVGPLSSWLYNLDVTSTSGVRLKFGGTIECGLECLGGQWVCTTFRIGEAEKPGPLTSADMALAEAAYWASRKKPRDKKLSMAWQAWKTKLGNNHLVFAPKAGFHTPPDLVTPVDGKYDNPDFIEDSSDSSLPGLDPVVPTAEFKAGYVPKRRHSVDSVHSTERLKPLPQTTPIPLSVSSSPPKGACLTFLRLGSCRYGKNCKFSHDAKDTRAQTAEHLAPHLQVCNMFTRTGNCRYGERCKFAHVVNDSDAKTPTPTTSPQVGPPVPAPIVVGRDAPPPPPPPDQPCMKADERPTLAGWLTQTFSAPFRAGHRGAVAAQRLCRNGIAGFACVAATLSTLTDFNRTAKAFETVADFIGADPPPPPPPPGPLPVSGLVPGGLVPIPVQRAYAEVAQSVRPLMVRNEAKVEVINAALTASLTSIKKARQPAATGGDGTDFIAKHGDAIIGQIAAGGVELAKRQVSSALQDYVPTQDDARMIHGLIGKSVMARIFDRAYVPVPSAPWSAWGGAFIGLMRQLSPLGWQAMPGDHPSNHADRMRDACDAHHPVIPPALTDFPHSPPL